MLYPAGAQFKRISHKFRAAFGKSASEPLSYHISQQNSAFFLKGTAGGGVAKPRFAIDTVPAAC
ncbi:MAG: hypothetical protein RSC98_07350, partial [Clostridia bacterium]